MQCTLLNMIVAAFVGIGVNEAWRHVLWPLFRALTTIRGPAPRIGGTWRYDAGIMKIRQLGTRIRAKATRHGSLRKFRYNGELRGGQLVLTWEEQEGQGYNMGAMVLRLEGNRKKLSGVTTFLRHDSAEVVSEPREYTR